jgi:hypothetical protein
MFCLMHERTAFWHKKTTHHLDRRFASSVPVSTADVIRLPNGAEFCIWAVIFRMLDHSKYDALSHQNCRIQDFSGTVYYFNRQCSVS